MAAIACLYVPRFPLAVELSARPELRGQVVVVAHSRRPEVAVTSAEAEVWGIVAGQPLSEAIARCPQLEVLDARPVRYAAIAERTMHALEQVAPGLEPVAEGLCFIDLRGLAAVHGGTMAMYRRLLEVATHAGPPPALGVAPVKRAALMAAQSVAPGQMRCIGPAEVDGFLRAQPVTGLDLEPEMLRRLQLFGIATLGDVLDLPSGVVLAQFGPAGGELVALARGQDEPVRPRPWHEQVVERLDLETPLTTLDPLWVAIEHVMSRAGGNPAFRERAARQLVLTLETEHDRVWQRTITFKEALSEVARMNQILRPQVMGVQLPGPVVTIRLELRELVWARGWQAQLLSQDSRQVELEEGLHKLRARYGHCPVERIVEVEPWNRIPERRRALTSFMP